MKKYWKWNEFGKVKSSEDLENYLVGREYGHTNYFHYTSLEIAKSIIRNHIFWLSNVSNFNDEDDKNQFGNEESCKRYFALCFSTGINENLPMWYLYAGVDGKGARISFTNGARNRKKKSAMRYAIEHGKYTLWEKVKEDGKYKLNNKITELTNKDNMIVYFGDIIYSKLGYGACDLKYNTMTNHKFPADDIEKFKCNHIGFSKDIVWYYEKETRLLIELKNNIIEKLDPQKEYVILWDFGHELLRSARLLFAPDITSKEFGSLIQSDSSIADLFNKYSHIKMSEYAGKIKLSPCNSDRCPKPKGET